MDPMKDAENENMPRKAAKTIDLTEEQRQTLFGDGPLEAGKSYTVTLKAGDIADSGIQTFEVGSKAEGEIETEVESEDSEASDESMGSEPQSSEAEISALGYDRSKLMKKKQAPKISAKDLAYAD